MPIGNGGIIGVANTPTLNSASGVWSLQEQELAEKAGAWPNIFSYAALALDFDKTTTLDSRITFTRATNGTFFNSSGVLSTASSGDARFDHRLEGGVWKNKGLLIEEQSTNLAERSEEFNDAYWLKPAAPVAPTVTVNTAVAPDGTTTADTINFSTSTTHPLYGEHTQAFTTGNVVTFSMFLKQNSGTTFDLQCTFFNNNNVVIDRYANVTFDGSGVATAVPSGSDVTVSVQSCGNGWYRISASTTSTGTATKVRFSIGPRGATGVGSVYAWGAQLEVRAFPTSYIKTTNASVTRNADVAVMTSTNFSSWYNQSEGTVFWQGDTVNTSTATGQNSKGWGISDNSTAERLAFSVGFEGNTRTFFVVDNNATQCNIFSPDPAIALVANQTYKAASVYKLNDFAHTLDGRTPGTDTSGTLPTVDRAYFGVNEAGNGGWLNGHIAKFYFWNTRRPNEFLQLITG
jgi:hypothetical protein